MSTPIQIVWVVEADDDGYGDDLYVHGVYQSPEAAMAAHPGAVWTQHGPLSWSSDGVDTGPRMQHPGTSAYPRMLRLSGHQVQGEPAD